MSVVVYGFCPDCGHWDPAGALVYSGPPVRRVVPCVCGSQKVPVEWRIKRNH